jgi:hypothetical protein
LIGEHYNILEKSEENREPTYEIPNYMLVE